ncbi:hypothetical protein Goari_017488, partial [Gossypium aridum]|nr:hypothetical protein [Gossypium aridum]
MRYLRHVPRRFKTGFREGRKMLMSLGSLLSDFSFIAYEVLKQHQGRRLQQLLLKRQIVMDCNGDGEVKYYNVEIKMCLDLIATV